MRKSKPLFINLEMYTQKDTTEWRLIPINQIRAILPANSSLPTRIMFKNDEMWGCVVGYAEIVKLLDPYTITIEGTIERNLAPKEPPF